MTTSKPIEHHSIDIQVNHHPSGNHTLKERPSGTNIWTDVQGARLFANSNVAQFYQALAHRLAEHASKGVVVSTFKDTAPKLF